ncbi:hypothetical protein [Solitalea longa]|uniref:hypothetical protein n=1 Tax=Solitalea longa TaxID=2079460 RepID=UPI0013FD1F87|nr:hypothetical protein [Solitalea longa]
MTREKIRNMAPNGNKEQISHLPIAFPNQFQTETDLCFTDHEEDEYDDYEKDYDEE